MNVCYVGGCGRLGLPFSVWSAEKGHKVIIADINASAVDAINSGEWDTLEPQVSELVGKHAGKNLKATTDVVSAVKQSEIIFIIVPTPTDDSGGFSLEYVLAACDEIRKGLKDGDTVVVSSTVMPGSTNGPIRESLERSGVDFNLAVNPEYVRQGEIISDFSTPEFVVIGGDTEVVEEYLKQVVDNDPLFFKMSLTSAEVAKLGLNVAVVSKLAVANQVAWLCQNIPDASARDALEAIGADSRVGSRYFSAGTYPAGPCFPRDCRAFAVSGNDFGVPMPPMMAINEYHKQELDMLARLVKSFDPEVVGIMGLAYRPGVNITDESQGLALALKLDGVVLHDPLVQQNPLDLQELADDCDVLVLMTCHDEYKELEEVDLSGTVLIDMWGYLDHNKINCEYICFGG